jgi:glycosyltransferase involved in cell wall biosynthesis
LTLTTSKPRVAVFVEYYLPGFRAGGPMRSVSALVQQLGHDFDFYVITRDRDEGSSTPYPDLNRGEWKTVGNATVRYLSPDEISTRHLAAAVREIQPQAIYLNSCFAPMSLRVLLARRLGALKNIPIVLAPRGELSAGALRLKAVKKRSFLHLAHRTGLYRDVIFHASTELENADILQAIHAARARVARNPITVDPTTRAACAKTAGFARFVFLSRIARKKNLHLALERLRPLKGSVEFDIYGPVIDETYWRECQTAIGTMPANVSVTYRGPVAHELVQATLSAHQFFLMPTANENFGHAIVEALLAGCPLVTSDQTPWRGLADYGVGWDLPLAAVGEWQRVMQSCVDMDAAAYERASCSARSFGHQIASADTDRENRALFQSILSNRSFESAR